MPFEIDATLDQVHTYLAGLAYFNHVQIGEPMDEPAGELAAAIFVESVDIPGTVLNAVIELHIITIRLYMDRLKHDSAHMEKTLAKAVAYTMKQFTGDIDVGANIRATDLAGMYGTSMTAQYGQITVKSNLYRSVDITVPLIVDSPDTTSS